MNKKIDNKIISEQLFNLNKKMDKLIDILQSKKDTSILPIPHFDIPHSVSDRVIITTRNTDTSEDYKNFHKCQKINYSDNRCLHENCQECGGTGKKRDGSVCIHMISCPCPICTPYC